MQETRTRMRLTIAASILVACSVAVFESCGSGGNLGKSCTSHDDCSPQTGNDRHTSCAGVSVARRAEWCFGGVCRRDCTGACTLVRGGCVGAGDAMDCTGKSSECESGESCNEMAGSTSSGYFVCTPD
jgi:hypothetical protein